jgi:hypothetical protein
VLNFHSSDDSYYEEWHEQLEDDNGWVAVLNMPNATQHDFKKARITNYLHFFELDQWRTLKPEIIFQTLDNELMKRLD